MKKLSFQNKLIYFTTATVTVIFAVAMALVYLGARDRAIERGLNDEQIDLDRNTELLSVMLRNGIPMQEVKRIAGAPWKDGSGNYIIVDNGFNVKQMAADEVLLTSTMEHAGHSFTVGEIVSENALLAPLQRTFNYLVGFMVLVIIVLYLAIHIAIKRLSQPEVDRQYRIDSELDIARRLQEGMLPSRHHAAAPATVEVGAIVSPSKEIGGDFYNYLTVGDYFHFIIADVSGKGVPAALYMSIATKLYASIAADDLTPAEIAGKLNDALCTNNPASMFTTATICRLSLSTGKVEICNAGHIAPLVSSASEAIHYLEGENNVPLGVIDGFKYEQYEATVEPGSHLMLYTDGVTEAEDKQRRQLGQLRFMAAAAVTGDKDASTLVNEIKRYIDNFTAGREQTDDITILDIKILPAARK